MLLRFYGALLFLFPLVALAAQRDASPHDQIAQRLRTAIQKSSFSDKCDDDASFAELSRPIKFLPLGKGDFLIQAECLRGAYNEEFLFFFYNQNTPQQLPRLILFPTDPSFQTLEEMKHWDKSAFDRTVGARAFDAKTLTIYAYTKGLGDGSIGYYTKYRFDKTNFLPQLELTIARNEEDHQAGYQFDLKKEPAGKGWARFKPNAPISGCFAKKLDDVSCSH